ncbi:polysaccharide pyruvyl transferase family protein [Bacillus sp. V3B]|uniref:polysaccharide pyruvyl transferase family protein n=1 Tax=Bacillus sp. V3B TaxID=2804915 RepID=UPI00210ABEC6|nr:polysaccharide pyruvyl transferase family protein [Bacillus sp. V3B]MCQ6275298.1 polysaccharide pyruvyl transferase family protein [Bacillus sp. V3B]
MDSIKKLVPVKIKRYLKVKGYIAEIKQQRMDSKKRDEFAKYLDKISAKRRIFILDACDHRNLGDQAILMAELQFLKDNFKDYEIISVGLGKFNNYVNIVKKHVRLDDIFVLHGGGNLGNEYKKAENTRRTIIQLFPNNQIILFPQTMYFTPNDEGSRELVKSKEIYSKHKQLTLIARERKSYDLMRRNFNNSQIILTPDIVLSLNKSLINEVRKGALFCCRNDIEGLLSEAEKTEILDILEGEFSSVSITDTVGESNFASVEEKFKEFRQAEIILTDRLHGMVFAAITGTPCIALSNYNYKVKGTYEWIKHLNYIKYTDSIDEVPALVEELKRFKSCKYDNRFAIPYYEEIKKAMRRN